MRELTELKHSDGLLDVFRVVSADADLTSMSPWRGRPIIEPPQFASQVDASRRARKRQR